MKDQARPMTPEAQVSAAGIAWLRRRLYEEFASSWSARAWVVLGILERERR